VRQTQQVDLFPKTAIKKLVGLFVANSVYHKLKKRGKNSFCIFKIKESKLFLISHLLLGEKTLRASAPKFLNSFGKMGGNQWDALRASRILVSKKPLSSILEPLYYRARTYFSKN